MLLIMRCERSKMRRCEGCSICECHLSEQFPTIGHLGRCLEGLLQLFFRPRAFVSHSSAFMLDSIEFVECCEEISQVYPKHRILPEINLVSCLREMPVHIHPIVELMPHQLRTQCF